MPGGDTIFHYWKIAGDHNRDWLSVCSTMNDPKFQQHGGAHAAEHPPHGPHWRRMHHSPFFWVAAFFILLAMVVYVTTNNLAFWPGKKASEPVPALAP
jgi:hypothetical protein